MSELSELQIKIDKADKAYYTEGEPIFEDAAYDIYRKKLEELNPDDKRLKRVGATTPTRDTMLVVCDHTIPMGSLDKATNYQEYQTWFKNNISKKVPDADNLLYHASYKMDGGSYSFEYRYGKLWRCLGRGDGIRGEDVTANALKFQQLPSTAVLNGKEFWGFIRGEVVLPNEDWLSLDPDQVSNPRNKGVGIVRRKNGEQSELLNVYAFKAFDVDGNPLGQTEEEQSELIKSMGFTCAPYFVGAFDKVWTYYATTGVDRKKLPYWIDGVVVKINKLWAQSSLGSSDDRPRGQVAIKFEAEGADIVLNGVTIQVGSTGAIVPVANFEPTKICGSMISNANLCNWDNIRELGVMIGDTVRVIKAGDIIPRVMSVVSEWEGRRIIDQPTQCPVCQGEVGHRSNIGGEDSAVLYCLNDKCNAKVVGKIERWVTSLNILGLGDAVLQALVSNLYLADPADLYTLGRKYQLSELLLSGKTRLGSKRVANILIAIEAKRNVTLAQLLGSLGIFGLGTRRVALIQESMPDEFDNLEDWFSGKLVKYAQQISLPNIAQRIQYDILANKQLIEKFMKNGIKIVKSVEKNSQVNPDSLVFCITGKQSQPKAYYYDLIIKAGHKATDTFDNDVTHLVAADPYGTSSKLFKAKKKGIPIITEAELLEMLD